MLHSANRKFLYFIADKGIFEIDIVTYAERDAAYKGDAVKEVTLPADLQNYPENYKLEQIERWGEGYFFVAEQNHAKVIWLRKVDGED